MSSIDLFLLGFLNKKSSSAYDLAKFIKDNHLHQMIKISTPSVYKNLVRLKERGFLSSLSTQSGNMSQKAVYSITKKGIKYFHSLMIRQSKKDFSIHFDFNSFIINLDQMNEKEIKKLLDNFKKVLLEKKRIYENYKTKFNSIPLGGKSIIKQLCGVNNLLIKWVNQEADNNK